MRRFTCPLCASPLSRKDATLTCSNAHTFDIAREGYVNLLPSHHRGSNKSGDDAAMIVARQTFLGRGHYDPLIDAIKSVLTTRDDRSLVDLGCGEGHFTNRLAGETTYGIDISKPAIKSAAKRYQDITFAVANTVRLPFADDSFDVVLVNMAPFSDDIARVIKSDGIVIRVTPGADHLIELKHVLYKTPMPHQPAEAAITNLQHHAVKEARFSLSLDETDRTNLIAMTPMQYRSSRGRQEEAIILGPSTTTAHFAIDTFMPTTTPDSGT